MGQYGKIWQYPLAVAKMLVDNIGDSFATAIESFEKQDTRTYKASFGDERDLLSPSNGGFNVTGTEEGFLSRATSYENVMVTGAIGSGKTAVVAIKTCMSLDNASAIVTDPSGQIREKVSGYLQRRGFRVLVLKFDSPYQSHSFNPLDFVRSKSDAFKMAYILVSCILRVGTGDNFWFLQSQILIYIFLSIVATQEKPKRHMASVRSLINRFAIKPQSLDQLFLKHASPELWEDWLALNQMEEKVLRSVIATAQSALQLWFSDDVVKSTCVNDIDFMSMRSTPTVLFVENPTANSKVYAPIISLFFETAFKELMSRLPSPSELDVYFVLDEVGTLRFESLGDILNNNRKFRLPTMTLWQSQEIIEQNFGIAEAESIRNASRTKVFLNGVGLKQSRELEELLGREEYEDAEGRLKVKPLMLAQEIRLMSADEALILSGSMKPLRVMVKPYFKQHLLDIKTKLPPFAFTNSRIPSTIPLVKLQ